jgi:hypothetical protein
MDDNSVTERQLRRGIRNEEQRQPENDWPLGRILCLSFPIAILLIITGFLFWMVISSFNEPEPKDGPDYVLVPEEFSMPLVTDMKNGQLKFVTTQAIKVNRLGIMFIDLDAKTSDKKTDECPIMIVRGEVSGVRGFHVSFHKPDVDKHPEKFQFNRKDIYYRSRKAQVLSLKVVPFIM